MKSNHPALLCLTSSYPSNAQDLSGHFVAHLNQCFWNLGYHPFVVAPAHNMGSSDHLDHTYHDGYHMDLIQQLQRIAMSRFITSGPYQFPQIRSQSWGNMYQQQGIPDWMSQHPYQASLQIPSHMLSLFHSYQKTYTLLKKYYDKVLVMSHWLLPNAFIAGIQRSWVYCHGGDIALLESLPYARHWTRFLLSRVEGVLCVSQNLLQRLEVLYGETLKCPHHVIPMGIEEPRVMGFNDALAKDTPVMRVSLLGRLVEIKGVDLVIDAYTYLSSQCQQDLQFIVMGTGSEKLKLQRQAQRYGDAFIFVGQQTAVERDIILSQSDLLIQYSRQIGHRVEGSPLALREALLHGCPVIASQHGGIQECYDDFSKAWDQDEVAHLSVNTVFSVIAGENPKLLAQAIEQKWREWKQGRVSDHIRVVIQRCANIWTWSTIQTRYQELFIS